MAHEIRRILQAFASRPWLISEEYGRQILAILELRAAMGPRAAPFREEPAAPAPPVSQKVGKIAVLNLQGPIVPRSAGIDDVSTQAASMEDFQRAFAIAARDESVKAIVLNIDSPGGSVDLVPETAAMIRAARNEERPIIAVANVVMCSAAYWLGVAADELVVSPSGLVGSIGVYMMHEDVSAALKQAGVKITFIHEGARKVEGNSFEPLSDTAKGALQDSARYYYDLFVADVAKGRNVAESIVRADPEKSERSFGAGRAYPAGIAVERGMADRIDTLDGVLQGLQARLSAPSPTRGARRASASHAAMRRRISVA